MPIPDPSLRHLAGVTPTLVAASDVPFPSNPASLLLWHLVCLETAECPSFSFGFFAWSHQFSSSAQQPGAGLLGAARKAIHIHIIFHRGQTSLTATLFQYS